jgi:hypothetical protein
MRNNNRFLEKKVPGSGIQMFRFVRMTIAAAMPAKAGINERAARVGVGEAGGTVATVVIVV